MFNKANINRPHVKQKGFLIFLIQRLQDMFNDNYNFLIAIGVRNSSNSTTISLKSEGTWICCNFSGTLSIGPALH